MTPHIQRVLGDGRGSCFSTSIACVLDLDLDDMPNVILFGTAWLEALGVWAWEKRVHVTLLRRDPGPETPAHVVGGPGPRRRPDGSRIGHAVVVERGRIVHDPHPSGAGIDLATAEDWWLVSRCPEAKGCNRCGLTFGEAGPTVGANTWRARALNEATLDTTTRPRALRHPDGTVEAIDGLPT